jgi:regulator of replication initiation timing
MRKNFSGLRGQFAEVVKENEVLKRQLHQFGNRLDEIQRDQHKMGMDTRNEISKIMNIAEKVAPGITRHKTPETVQQTRATAAQNAAASLNGRLAASSVDNDAKLKPG